MVAALSLAEARRIALAAQGFGRARPAEPTMRHVQGVIDRVAQVQIDSVNVAVRAHLMPLFSRLGPYDPALLERATATPPRRLFEYWGHAASLIDVRLQPALRPRMAALAARSRQRLAAIAARHPGLPERVLAEIAERGPLTAREIEHDEVVDKQHWGWNWSSVKSLLEIWFSAGEVSSAGRNAHFERRYDLMQRVLPPQVHAAATPTDAEARVVLVRRAAAALGIARLRCLADYFRMSVAGTRSAVDQLVDTGELVPTPVRGWTAPAWLWHEAAMPRRVGGQALISPFDSLVFERERLLDLFGIHYRIGIYTPEAERIHGYYVYLFVRDGAFVARVDLKADRAAGRLLVQSAWLEPEAEDRRTETAVALAGELAAMARWLGLSRVSVQPRGTLSAELARASPGAAG